MITLVPYIPGILYKVVYTEYIPRNISNTPKVIPNGSPPVAAADLIVS